MFNLIRIKIKTKTFENVIFEKKKNLTKRKW
jgi:hypothetical protein